jgi:hypothetical protein
MMRFRGGGVGHKTTREATNSFKRDRDPLDDQETSAGFNNSESESDSDEVDEDETIIDGEIREEEEDNREEEEDYGYAREGSSEEDSDTDDDAEPRVDEAYFGPEDDGGAIDPDMDALGYAEM